MNGDIITFENSFPAFITISQRDNWFTGLQHSLSTKVANNESSNKENEDSRKS